jgi:TrmH family RNA methyltransferase
MITSTSNASIRHIQKLLKKRELRQQEGVFVVEGFRSFKEVPADRLAKAYISESAARSEQYDVVKALPHEIVSDAVMAAVSDTKNAQGFLAIVKQNRETEITYRKDGLYLLLDHLQDPGNLGTILRMCEAAGVTSLIMSSDTVDVYNPKVVRATMGTIFRVPFRYVENLSKTIQDMKKNGIAVYGASLEQSVDYAGLDYRTATAFVIGNEANGLSEETVKACTGCVHIPMQGAVESLNAAVAAAVLTFEAYRQKRV